MEELVGSEEDGELAGLVERSLGVLSGLRRERTGRLMAELLVRRLRRRDDTLSSLGSVLASLTHFLSSLTSRLSPHQGHRPDRQRVRLGPGLGGTEDRAEQDLHSREHREHQLSYLSNKLKLQ